MSTSVTLHRASRIDEEIKRAIGQLDAPTTEGVSVFTENPAEAVGDVQERVQANIQRMESLMAARGRLREAVGQKNAEVGINHYLARKNALDQRIQLLKQHVETNGISRVTFAHVLEPEDAVQQVPARRKRLEASDAPVDDTVTVRTLDPATRETLADRLLELRRELEGITEKLRELNNTTTIEIPDEDVFTLRRERIVV